MPLGMRQPSGQFVALDRLEGIAHVAGAPHVGRPRFGQADERRHARAIGAAKLGGDRTHRRISAAVVAVVGAARQRSCRPACVIGV